MIMNEPECNQADYEGPIQLGEAPLKNDWGYCPAGEEYQF